MALDLVGLCTTCLHAERIPHPRGGAGYWRCKLGSVDARFPKYPRLPVTRCAGYKKEEAMIVRNEEPGDIEAVHAINAAAFGREAEAVLVDRLRAAGKAVVSLVAEKDGAVVGHILFSPVRAEAATCTARIAGLAPMAVLPAHQRSGAGSQLIRAGLETCRAAGYNAVVVLGHPKYYPRFGFVPANRFGIQSVYGVPDEVFMALELEAGALTACGGTVHYADEFADV